MENATKLSIVVLTYNALEYTKKCLESIFENTDSTFELIVVDNNSTDGTKDWLREEVRCHHLFLNTENKGVAGGRNQGIAKAIGEYIVFLDNDTEVGKGWDTVMLRHFNNDQRVMIVGNRGHGVESYNPLAFTAPFNIDGVGLVDVVPGYCFMFKSVLIDLIGNQWEDFPYPKFWHEDLEFCARARMAGFLIVADTNIPIVHYEHKSMGDKVVGAEESKIAQPGFDENAAFVEKRLAPDNVMYYHRDFTGHDNWSAYDRIAEGIIPALRKQGLVVLRQPSRTNEPFSFHLCKGGDFTFDGRNYCHMFLENDRPPRNWAKGVENFDVVLAGSRHVFFGMQKEPYKDKVVDLGFAGIDIEKYRPDGPIVEETGWEGKYIFMVLAASQPRKNTKNLIKWYFETFTADHNVLLLIKDSSYGHKSETYEYLQEFVSKQDSAKVYYTFDHWTTDYMAGVFRRVAKFGCFISPHRAEGFGMPHLEAVACGCKIATTGYGGPAFNLSDDIHHTPLNGVKFFDYTLVPSSFHNWEGECFYEDDVKPLWAEPVERDVKILMEVAYSTKYIEYDITKTSNAIREKFSYETRAKKLIDYLKRDSKDRRDNNK